MEKDIRWIQRFENYLKAFEKLKQAVEFINEKLVDDLEFLTNNEKNALSNEILKEGLIQRFEYTHELAWNVMKDYAEYQGNTAIGGSRDATREAFSIQIIENGRIWMDMINSRNISSHTYHEEVALEIFTKIINEYFAEFKKFSLKMSELKLNQSK
jgi:nucleotidyltransferase substrate binding protein (TIGR01987 family)